MSVFKDKFTNTWSFYVRYKNWQGETKQYKRTGSKSQKEAKAKETEFLDKHTESTDISFASLVEYYLQDCKARLKPTTYSTKEYIINLKIVPYFEKLRIIDITPVKVRTWQTMLMSDPKGYAPTYLKTINNQLSAIMNFACRLYGLKQNPCHITGSMGKKRADLTNFWTPDEFNKFLLAVSDKPVSKLMFTLLYFSGMRIGEALALTMDDFDFNKNTVKVSKNYARLHGEDLIMPPKTPKSNRTITLPASVMNLVREYRFRLYDYESSERLFPHTKSYLEWEMIRGCKLSGVKKIRLHDIRHSHASMLLELGTPIKQVSERLGHENIETTLQTYSHLYKNKEKELVDKLEDLCVKHA